MATDKLEAESMALHQVFSLPKLANPWFHRQSTVSIKINVTLSNYINKQRMKPRV